MTLMRGGSGTHQNGQTSTTTTGNPNPENFAKFYQQWIENQTDDLHALLSATTNFPNSGQDEQHLRPLIDRVISNYESYYHHKSQSASSDVLLMFNPPWVSSTEHLLLWAGGWRPTIAFHLLMSKSGIQLDSQLDQILRGIRTCDLADITPDQLERLDELQRKTVMQEKEISEEEAKVQESVANKEMVELVNAISMSSGVGGEHQHQQQEQMEREMEGKEEGMKMVLERGDNLRVETIKSVVGILRPLQAVHFLIAAAELHLRVHEFGVRKDAKRSAEV